MYEYLAGSMVFVLVWAIIFFTREDLRKGMVVTGTVYTVLLSLLFGLQKVAGIFFDVSATYNPGYWTPTTLFDLSNRLGGASIEDGLFVFFSGGIVAALYGLTYAKGTKSGKRSYAPIIAYAIAYLVLMFVGIGPLYLLVIPALTGAFTLWFVRQDLIRESLVSAVLFTILYTILFLLFLLVFPDYLVLHYSDMLGIGILGIPIEEFMYAFSFALMWGPIHKALE